MCELVKQTNERLGTSEVDLVNIMIEGCAKLVRLETKLEKGEPVFEFTPGLGDDEFPGFPAGTCPAKNIIKIS